MRIFYLFDHGSDPGNCLEEAISPPTAHGKNERDELARFRQLVVLPGRTGIRHVLRYLVHYLEFGCRCL